MFWEFFKVNVKKNDSGLIVEAKDYKLSYDPARPMHVGLKFNNGIGAELFVASGCDRDEMIDEIITLDKPVIEENGSETLVSFVGKTTLWEKAVYTFRCLEDKVLYSYKVDGDGKLDNARFFEGFLKDDPRMKSKHYPLFCGWAGTLRGIGL